MSGPPPELLPGSDTTPYTKAAEAYTDTLSLFFVEWMTGSTLAQCITDASNRDLSPCAFPVLKNVGVTIRTLDGYHFTFRNLKVSPICVIGHSGLTVTGLKEEFDGFYPPPDSNK
jgi:hypothetical protein